MIAAALSLFLFFAQPPFIGGWADNRLTPARIGIETPEPLKPASSSAEKGAVQQGRWTAKSGLSDYSVSYRKWERTPAETPRESAEAFGKRVILGRPKAELEIKERTFAGKPGFEVRVTEKGQVEFISRIGILREGDEEWRFDVTYSPEYATEPDYEHFFSSFRLLSAPELPELVSQSPGPKLTVSLPGKPTSQPRKLTEEQQKTAKSGTAHVLQLPDKTNLFLIHTEYADGAQPDLKRDFSSMLGLALSQAKEKDVPKVEVLRLPNGMGYQARSRTWMGDTEATYRILTFQSGQHAWSCLFIGPNTVRHEQLLDQVVKSLTVAP